MDYDPCSWCREQAAAFALGDLDGQERAALIRHLESCSGCRHETASLAAALDAISTIVPPLEPSPDFVDRVVDGLTSPPGNADPPPKPPPIPRRHRRRTVCTVTLALLAVIAGLVTTKILDGHAGHPRPVVVAMRTQRGERVGTASIYYQHPTVVTVAFDVVGTGLSPDSRYQVIALQRDGHTLQLGTVLVTKGRGGLEARTALPALDVAAVEVVASNGQDLCSGQLAGAPPPPSGFSPPPSTR